MMILSRKRNTPVLDVHLDGKQIPQVATHKHLGLVLNRKLSWTDHTDHILKKAAKKVGLLRRFRRRLPPLVLRSLYITCVRPSLEYASTAWGGLGAHDSNRLERLQRSAARAIIGVSRADHLPHDLLLARAGLEQLSLRRSYTATATAFHLTQPQSKGPGHLRESFQHWLATAPKSTSNVGLRSAGNSSIRLPKPRTELLRLSPFYRGVSFLNALPSEAKSSLSYITTHILS